MRRVAFFAFAALMLLSGSLFGLNVGDALPDNNGLLMQYAEGRVLSARIEDHKLCVYFLDENRRVVPCPFAKVVARIDRTIDRTKNNRNDINMAMLPDDKGVAVRGPRFIKPPYAFKLHLLLCPDADSEEGRISLPMASFRWEGGDSEQ